MQRTSIDWTHLRDDAGAAGLAKAIEASKRQLRGGTSLGGAIRFSLERIENNRFEGRRKVIDVSGDGFTGHNPRRERDRALARGVTVNGLAIENEEPGLGAYYAEHGIGGSGAFVITIQDFGDFTLAIRQKLIREIAGMEVAAKAGKDRRLRLELSDYVAIRNCKECILLQRCPRLVSKRHTGQEKNILVRRGHRYSAPFNGFGQPTASPPKHVETGRAESAIIVLANMCMGE